MQRPVGPLAGRVVGVVPAVLGPVFNVDDKIEALTASISGDPNVQTAGGNSITPTFSNDVVQRLAANGAITMNNPTGTARDGWGIVVRLRDNGTARAIRRLGPR